MKYLFGPINSRRLGVSLGIDLLPRKTCSLDCVYCECGGTTRLTAAVSEYVPAKEVIKELDSFLSASPVLDSLTFSGSGEPTLHSGIGEIISHIKSRYPRYWVTVLTNGTLLWREEVRARILEADCVIPSLDAVSGDIFSRILRPAGDVSGELLCEGIIKFAAEYSGELFIEVFIIPGVNDSEAELAKIKNVCLQAAPLAVQLNSLDRPGTEKWVAPVPDERLLEIKKFFEPLFVIIPSRGGIKPYSGARLAVIEKLKETIARRPSTAEELAATTCEPIESVKKELERMVREDIVKAEANGSVEFFSLKY